MSEQELCERYLSIIEDAVTCFEPLWVDDSDRIPNSGFFDFRKYDTWKPRWYAPEITVPGNGMVAYCYSVLLNETDKEAFTAQRIPRATLLDHAIKSIRWWCLTSAYVKNPYAFGIPSGYERRMKGENWVRPFGHRTDVMGWPTMAAARLWDFLDGETKQLVEDVMIGVAPTERLVRSWAPNGQGGNHDIVKQDMASTIGAAFTFPSRDDAKQYLDVIRGNGIDMVSTLHDKACDAVADGKLISDRSRGWNLYQDYSSDHHGWAQVWYGGDMLFEGRCYVELLSRLTGIPVPETFTYKGNGFDGVLEWHKRLCLPEGEPASVHGMEYDAYYGAGLLAYCYGATVKKDPVAAALEERAAGLLERHTRAVRVYDYHRNSWAKAATALLMHKYAGPRAEPVSFNDAWHSLSGAYHHRWQQNLIHRAPRKWASFSWGSLSGPKRKVLCGFVVPPRGFAPNLEPLVYLHPRSLVGETAVKRDGEQSTPPPPESLYRYCHSDAGFSTAGIVSEPSLDRYYAFWSFDGGPCVIFTVFQAREPCQLSWSGLPVYFYGRPGMTSRRRYDDAEGTQPLEQAARRSSSWWCVNDVLGMAVIGGNGKVTIERSVGNNWARTDAYRDKCDGVFVSPIPDKKLGAGSVAVDLAVAIYTDTPHQQVAQACRRLEHNPRALPAGWKDLIVPDPALPEKRYLAVANLYGEEAATTIELSFPKGAPVMSIETAITGKTGSFTLQLAGSETFGQTLELYAESLDGRTARASKETQSRYRFRPAGDEKVRLRLHYAGDKADAFVITPENGSKQRRITPDELDDQGSFVVELDHPTRVEIQGQAYLDHVGPAVEIVDAAIREDDRVTIEVAARDQSGIENVELYCDGKLVGRQSVAPYLWLHRPGKGAHTYHAVATDAAPERNRRASFKRTIEVGAGGLSRWDPSLK